MTPVAMHIKALLALPSVLPTLTGQPIWLPIHSGPYSGPFSRDLPLRTPKDTTFLMGVEAAAGPTGLIRNACFVGKIQLLRSAQSHESPQIRPEPNTGKQMLSTTSPCRLLTCRLLIGQRLALGQIKSHCKFFTEVTNYFTAVGAPHTCGQATLSTQDVTAAPVPPHTPCSNTRTLKMVATGSHSRTCTCCSQPQTAC